MFFIVDIIRSGDEHRTTNFPTIQALNDLNLINQIWISSDSTSLQALKNTHTLLVNKVVVTNSRFYRWIFCTFLTFSILLKAAQASNDVIFLSATPIHTFLISIFSRFTRKRCKYFIFLHGELSYLVWSVGLGQKLGALFLRESLRKISLVNVTYITLAYPIYFNLSKNFPGARLRNLELPSDDFSSKSVSNRVPDKFRIGSFGIHCFDKNSHLIYDLANKLDHMNSKIELVTIGIAHGDFKYDQHPSVLHFCKGETGGKLIDRKLFIEQIQSLDMALIFQGNSLKYQLISSGVFNDCVNNCIPIAGIDSSYISYYSDKYGQLGLMASGIDELAKEICDVANNTKILEAYKSNILKFNRDIRFSNFKKNIVEIINE